MQQELAQKLEGVISWLEAGEAADYRTGVLQLQQHSGNRNLVNSLLKKESAGNREKLRYELLKVVCGGRIQDMAEVTNHFAQAVQTAVALPVVDPSPATPAPNAPEVTPAQPEATYEQLPEAARLRYDELTQQMSKVYNQRVQLSNSLADLKQEDGPQVVAQILSLQSQYNALFEQRQRLQAGEPLPEQPVPGAAQPAAPVLDRAELVKQRNTLRSNISKAKKKAEEAKTDVKRSEYEQKAGYLAVELALVQSKLALPEA